MQTRDITKWLVFKEKGLSAPIPSRFGLALALFTFFSFILIEGMTLWAGASFCSLFYPPLAVLLGLNGFPFIILLFYVAVGVCLIPYWIGRATEPYARRLIQQIRGRNTQHS